MTQEILFAEVDLSEVMKHAAKTFTLTNGAVPVSSEAFVDVGKNKVIFKFIVEVPNTLDAYTNLQSQ